MNLYFFGSVAVLAVLLFFPVSRLVWILSIRRKERKLQRGLTGDEIAGERSRARFIAIPMVALFSFLFNLQLL